MTKRVLVTGATGFVGPALVTRLANGPRFSPVAAVRRTAVCNIGVDVVRCGSLGPTTDWSSALSGVDAVVHLAARVHVMEDGKTDPLSEFRRINVQGTLRLARQAAGADVRRFVFVSSIKVNGERTVPGTPFTAHDDPAPEDAYGVSKMEAEQALLALARETEMEVVVVRPPLVYGPGVGANFGRMMQWVARGVPLPLGAVDNRRSLVGLDNLVDLLVRCLEHPSAAGQTFLAGDGEDVSTTELLRRVARAMTRPTRLVPLPPVFLRAGASLLGKKEIARRLLDSLQVDITHTRETLGWEPPVSLDQGLRRAVEPLVGKTHAREQGRPRNP